MNNSSTVGEIIQFLETRAPSGTAESWDNVGLLIGDPSQKTSGAIISIDLTEEALELAVKNQYSLIINHHPCLFPKGRGPSRLLSNSVIAKAIRHGISVAAYHTNFDQCALEVVEKLAHKLQVVPKGRLIDGVESPSSTASSKGLVRGVGYGFWGEFPSPRPFSELAKDAKNLFNIRGFWITQPAPETVSRIGFVAGKGASFVEAASSLGCDLFITGEAGYHTATHGIDGCRREMAVMEIGHRESERFFMETMKDWLSTLGMASVEVHSPTQTIMV